MRLTIILTLCIALAITGTALAVGKGKQAVYETSAGKVIFDGTIHAEKGGACKDCHPAIAPMKKGGLTMKKEDHVPGKACGVCHDGKKAFAQDEANCGKCHKK